MKKIENTEEETLYSRIAEVIEGARHQVAQTANLTMVYCYYEIGRMIVEDEQQGNHRAGYGEKTLQGLSVKSKTISPILYSVFDFKHNWADIVCPIDRYINASTL